MKKANKFLNKPINLLPSYFKIIGLGLVIGSTILGISNKYFHFITVQKEILKPVLLDVWIIALSFIAFAKDKVEDELTMLLRMKAIIAGVVFGLTFVVASDTFSLIIQEPMEKMTAYGIIIQILIMNIIYYNSFKLFR